MPYSFFQAATNFAFASPGNVKRVTGRTDQSDRRLAHRMDAVQVNDLRQQLHLVAQPVLFRLRQKGVVVVALHAR